MGWEKETPYSQAIDRAVQSRNAPPSEREAAAIHGPYFNASAALSILSRHLPLPTTSMV